MSCSICNDKGFYCEEKICHNTNDEHKVSVPGSINGMMTCPHKQMCSCDIGIVSDLFGWQKFKKK
jgi:hypothetical protein